MEPFVTDHAIDRYVEKIDASASRRDAVAAIKALVKSSRTTSSDRTSERRVSNGIVLILTHTTNTVTTVYPEPRSGESEDKCSAALLNSLSAQSRFVVVEGIDAAGKSTLIRGLKESLPRGTLFLSCNRTPVGLVARKLMEAGENDFAIQGAMVADKFLLNKKILAARDEGRTVVLDRWTYSAMAYAPHLRPWLGVPYAYLDRPTHVLWLEIPVSSARKRIAGRGGADSDYEASRLGQAHSYYVSLREEPNWHRIDAMQSPDAVLKSALAVLNGEST